MAYNLTAEEAAARLGVSKGRVYQLIEAGALKAEKFGRSWIVDEASVAARAAKPVAAGRPARVALAGTRPFELMSRTHAVLSFECVPQTAAFTKVTEIADVARAPLGVVSPRGASASVEALSFWWAHRAIPGSRRGLADRLRELGVEAAGLPFGSLGLSLSDQYWVRPAGSALRWEDVNYFNNDFDLADGGWLASVGLSSPDNTSEGELPKKWLVEGGERILLKGAGPLGQEPVNEALATRLHSLTLQPGEYVEYSTRNIASGLASACRCFVSDTEEYIPAYYVRQLSRRPNHRSEHRHYIECCALLGADGAEQRVAETIVCDDILANRDRHWRNFGVIRDVETLECRMAPIFDSGSSLWCDAPTSQLAEGRYRFSTKPFLEEANRQLLLAGDLSWLDLDAMQDFPDEVEAALAANPATTDRASYVADAVKWRLDRLSVLKG